MSSAIFTPTMAGPGDAGGWDLFQQLLRKRIVFLGDAIDDCRWPWAGRSAIR